jgi:hypothetical protein
VFEAKAVHERAWRTARVPASAARTGRRDLNRFSGIDLSIGVKKCTQECLCQVEIGP